APARADVVEALLGVARTPVAARARLPAWLAGLARLILPSLRALEHPAATAADALRVAERLAVLFPDAGGTEPVLAGLPDLLTLLLDAGPGDALPGSADDTASRGPSLTDERDGLPDELRDALTLLVDEQLGDAAGETGSIDPH